MRSPCTNTSSCASPVANDGTSIRASPRPTGDSSRNGNARRRPVFVATIRPMAIHVGEGVNHYFHATLHNRATYLVAMLTGQIGIPGSGVSGLAINGWCANARIQA